MAFLTTAQLQEPGIRKEQAPPFAYLHVYRAVVVYKKCFGDTPIPAQGAAAPYVSLVNC